MSIIISKTNALQPENTGFAGIRSAGLAARLRRMMDNYSKRSEERTRLSMNRQPWPIWNTQLSKYAETLGLNLETHLLGKIADAKKSGMPYPVLDVGGGSFDQWEAFYAKNNLPVPCPWLEMWGTSLQLFYVNQNFRRFVKKCDVAGIGKEFLPKFEGHFDLIVSHAGMHDEEIIGLLELRNLVKVGGEIWIVEAPGAMSREIIGTQMPYYQILASHADCAYRLKKIS